MDTGHAHDGLLRELNEERAAALFRISRRLETLIDDLHARRMRVDASSGPARAAEAAQFERVRAEALEYRWYLEVQREAIGLRSHRLLDDFYVIPRLESP